MAPKDLFIWRVKTINFRGDLFGLVRFFHSSNIGKNLLVRKTVKGSLALNIKVLREHYLRHLELFYDTNTTG